MEQVLRKIVETLVLMVAYIPMGFASIAFFGSLFVFLKYVFLWVKDGKWLLPKLFETINMDFLSFLMDDSVSGFRISLIKIASKLASLPTPVFLIIAGTLCLGVGLSMIHFAKKIKEAGVKA